MTTAEHASAASPATSVGEGIRNWSLVALILYVVNGLAFGAFSAAGGIWFTVSDAVGLLLALALMILVIKYDELFRPLIGSSSRTARWVGVVAMGLGIAGSIVLLTAQTGHEFVPGDGGLGMQFAGWGLHGVWFLMIASFGANTGLFSIRWIWAARIAGAGSIIAMAATIPLGPDSVAVSLGFAVTFIAIVVWVLRARKDLAEA